MKSIKTALAAVILLCAGSIVTAFAGPDHSEFIKGPFKDGVDVTKACLECHRETGHGCDEDDSLELERHPQSCQGNGKK